MNIPNQVSEGSVRPTRDDGDTPVEDRDSRGHTPDVARRARRPRGRPAQQVYHALYRPRPVHGPASGIPRHRRHQGLDVHLYATLLNLKFASNKSVKIIMFEFYLNLYGVGGLRVLFSPESRTNICMILGFARKSRRKIDLSTLFI